MKLYKILTSKIKNISYFKIHNLYLTWCICIFYILFFIIGLYFLRIINRNNLLDLNLVCSHVLFSMDNLSFIVVAYFFFFSICSLIILFLFVLIIHKKAGDEFFKLFIYYNENDFLKDNKYTGHFYKFSLMFVQIM